MLWDFLHSSYRIRWQSGYSHLKHRLFNVCSHTYWLCNCYTLCIYKWMFSSKTSLYIPLHSSSPALPSSPLLGLKLARTGGPIKFSLYGPAGKTQRKRPISLLCKPLFHFHTSLSVFLLWYFTGFLASVQVWTQYSDWDHGSHLLVCTKRLQLPPFAQSTTTTSFFSFHFLILIFIHDASETDSQHRHAPSCISSS